MRRLLEGAIGAMAELGEVAGEIKSYLFHSTPLDRARVEAELGDVLWYIDELAEALGFTLEDIFEANAEKLRQRKASWQRRT